MWENLDKDQWCYTPESINKLQHFTKKKTKPSLTGQKRFFSLNWYQTLTHAGGKKNVFRVEQDKFLSITRLVTCNAAKCTGITSTLTGLALCKWRLKDQAKKKIRECKKELISV